MILKVNNDFTTNMLYVDLRVSWFKQVRKRILREAPLQNK